jgi:hypothetical protein
VDSRVSLPLPKTNKLLLCPRNTALSTTSAFVVAAVIAIGVPGPGPPLIRLPVLNIIMGPAVRFGPIRKRHHRRLALVLDLLEGFTASVTFSPIPRRQKSV